MSYSLKLSPPAYLTLELPDGSGSVKIDVFEARRVCFDEAAKKPNEAERWKYLKDWLGARLQVQGDQIAESTAIEFNNAIAKLVDEVNKQTSKKLVSIVSSQPPIPASPETSPSGETI